MVTFKELLDQKQWTNYSEFVNDIPRILSKEIKENTERDRKLINDIKNDERFKKLNKRKVDSLIPEAEKNLLSGNVVGIDGTRTKYELLSGVKCQIGIVAVNYSGEQIKHSFFISSATLPTNVSEDIIERITGNIENEQNMSEMALRGLMMYREREIGFTEQFKGKYIMFHGHLLPFELMSGLGRLRALEVSLDLLRKLVSDTRFFSVVSSHSSSFKEYAYFGRALNHGEYFTAENYTLGHHLANASDFLRWKSKWREDELADVEEFLVDYAEQIQIGVIRIGQRTVIFHAHKDNFDKIAAIIARDSMFQKEKSFPLLIDYADNLCSVYFSGSEFQKMIEFELSKNNVYLTEASERGLRRK